MSGLREQSKLFEESDVEALTGDVTGVRSVAPTASKSMQAIYGNANWSTTVYGINDGYFDVRNGTIQSGREFSESEIKTGGAVCIIGTKVRKQLFADQDPIGAKLRLQAISCQVVGLLATKGQGGMRMDRIHRAHPLECRRSSWRRRSSISLQCPFPEILISIRFELLTNT